MTNEQAAAAGGNLSWTTRIAYGLGDTAQNVVWGAMSILTFFYTDYAGIDVAMVGLVMLLSRCFDGFSDIIMGFIVERTHSKWGKARPWILWMSLPFAVTIVLIYTVPQGVSSAMQFAYIFVTYNLCTTVVYTALNLPYGSLSAMMTRISKERDMLSIVRMTLSPFGKILTVSATLPLVKIFGDTQSAWVEVMSVWAVLSMALLLFCFSQCKETVVIEARKKVEEKKLEVGKSLKCLFFNKYFLMSAALWTMQNVIFYVTGTVLPYYCKYIFHNDALYSILFLLEMGVMVSTQIFLSPWLLKKFGKRNMALGGIALAFVGHLIYLLNPLDFSWVIFSCFIRGVGFAPLNSVLFGFLGDAVEYGQWKFHVRQEGLIFSGGSVGTKVGSGLTSAILTSMLAAAGYVSSNAGAVGQPESAIQMIIDLYMWGPIVCWMIIGLILYAYRLDKIYPQIMRELVAREAKGEL